MIWKNGNSVWVDAIQKEMENFGVAFTLLPSVKKSPPGWNKASVHLVFNFKTELTRNEMWVKDGHSTPEPTTSSYSGVVSHERIRIAMNYATLRKIDIMTADIRNAYIQGKPPEKNDVIYITEFGL